MLQDQQQHVERENKLQNAVQAFSAVGKGKMPEKSAMRKLQGRDSSKLNDEFMIGHGGRDFDDVDCERAQVMLWTRENVLITCLQPC